MKKRALRLSLPFQIVFAVLLGSWVGWIVGPRAEPLGELGTLFIQLLKALATPLIFFAIVDAFVKTPIRLKSAARLLMFSLMNASVAGMIAILISSIAPYSMVSSRVFLEWNENRKNLEIGKSWIPQGLFDPLITTHVILVIGIAVIIGIVLRRFKENVRNESKVFRILENFFGNALKWALGSFGWIVYGVPLAVFGVVSKMVGTSGFVFFSVLGEFVTIVVVGMFIHVVLYYSLILTSLARVSPFQFFGHAGEAVSTAFGTGSSLATLPVTLRTLREKMKVTTESAHLASCIGTNLNHTGILLYEVVAAFFIAQVHGIHLGVDQKIAILGTSAIAAAGIAGVPDAGLITLSLVLSAAGLPLTFVPVLMTVDWFIGRLRASVNVVSDLVVATLLDHWGGAK